VLLTSPAGSCQISAGQAVGRTTRGKPDARDTFPVPHSPEQHEARTAESQSGLRVLQTYLMILTTGRRRRCGTFADREAQTVLHGDGWISFTEMLVLSPGITISVPSGSVTTRSRRWCGSRTADVVVEERRVRPPRPWTGCRPALEVGVRRGGAGLDDNLTALDVSRLMPRSSRRRCRRPAWSSSLRTFPHR